MASLIHLRYIITLAAMLARDILLLRSLLIVAQVIVATYAFSMGHAGLADRDLELALLRHQHRLGDPDPARSARGGAAGGSGADLRAPLRGDDAAGVPALVGDRPARDGARSAPRLSGAAARTRCTSSSRARRASAAVGVPIADLPAGFFVAEMSLITGQPRQRRRRRRRRGRGHPLVREGRPRTARTEPGSVDEDPVGARATTWSRRSAAATSASPRTETTENPAAASAACGRSSAPRPRLWRHRGAAARPPARRRRQSPSIRTRLDLSPVASFIGPAA